MEIEEHDLTKHKIIITKNNLESLIESYRRRGSFILVFTNTPSYFIFSIIKEKLDQGLTVNCIVELDIFKRLEIFQRFDPVDVKESSVKIPFHKKSFALAQRILEKAFELYIERKFNYKIPYISYQLSSGAVKLAKEITEKNYINQNFFERFSQKILKEFERYKIVEIPEFLTISSSVAESKIIVGKQKKKIDFMIIYNELLNLQRVSEEGIEEIITKLERDFIYPLKDFYLGWNLDKSEQRPFLISDTLSNLFGILFSKEDEFHPLVKGKLPKDHSNNVVLLIFDNLGYFDLLRGINKSKIWANLEDRNEITIHPAFSSFITSTDYALSYLIREDKGEKSFIEKIVNQMIEEKDRLSIIICSQWSQNNPYNKKLFDSKRKGFLRIPETIFTLNTLKSYLKEIENKHFLIIYSCLGIPHENTSFEKISEQIEQNVVKRISEAISLFPNSTIMALGDHGVQWTHQKIEGGEKLDNNKRISKIPIKNYTMDKINVDNHEILQLLYLETKEIYPLKPTYTLELPNTKNYHGGFSFSEIVVPLIICKPSKKKIRLETEKEPILSVESNGEELRVQKEELIPLEKIRDLILLYLEKNGPSVISEITKYVDEIKNKEFSTGLINSYLHSLLKYGNVVKGNPSEGSGKRAKMIIWYLPKHEDRYEKLMVEKETKILNFIIQKKACLFKPIHTELGLRRNYALSIVNRLIFLKKIKFKEFERVIYIYNKLVYSKAKIYFIPEQEDYALKRIPQIQSSWSIHKSQDNLISRLDLLIAQLNKRIEFEVPEIIKTEAFKIALATIEKKARKRGQRNIDLLGACIFLVFRRFKIPISLNLISEAGVQSELILKNKELGEIDDLERLYSTKKKNIRKFANKIRSLLGLKTETLSYEDYLNFITLQLNCPYYFHYFGSLILKELESVFIPAIDRGGLVGGIIYYIIRKIKPLGIGYRKYTQETIAKSVNLTEPTIRNVVKFLGENIKKTFSDEINKLENNIEKSTSFKEIKIYTQEGRVVLASYPKGNEILIRGFIKHTIDHKLVYNDIPPIKDLTMQKSLIFFLENNIIEGILEGTYLMIISSNDFMKNIIPGRSRVFVCQNSVDKNLRLSFTPRAVLLNLPLSFVKKIYHLACIELAEFYIQTINTELIHLILIDPDSIDEHSIGLFDILEKLDIEEYQKSIIVQEVPINQYILEFEDTIEEETIEVQKDDKSRKQQFLEWLAEDIPEKEKSKYPIKDDKVEEELKSTDFLEDFRRFIESDNYLEILNVPKDCKYIIIESIKASQNDLYHPGLEAFLTSLETLLNNYHSKFLKSTVRLEMHKTLSELWKNRLISKNLRDKINILARCRNEVKHGRKIVKKDYFNTYYPLIIDSIKQLCYESFQIPAIHKILAVMGDLEFIREHSLIPIQKESEILKKWLFNKTEQMTLYESDQTIDDIDFFKIIVEFFPAALKDKKRKKFYFSIEFEVERRENEFVIKKIEEL